MVSGKPMETKESVAMETRLQQFAAKVRKYRMASGLTQEGLSVAAGLHRTYISDIERGSRSVSLKNLFRLSDALAVSPSELVA
jgi:transcriptional regulator with XRE-family HTH domain